MGPPSHPPVSQTVRGLGTTWPAAHAPPHPGSLTGARSTRWSACWLHRRGPSSIQTPRGRNRDSGDVKGHWPLHPGLWLLEGLSEERWVLEVLGIILSISTLRMTHAASYSVWLVKTQALEPNCLGSSPPLSLH